MFTFYSKQPVRKADGDKGGKPPRKGRSGLQRDVTATYKRQEALLKAMGQVMRVDLVKGIETFKDKIKVDELEAAWATGDYEKVRHLIPWADFPEDLEPAFTTIGATATESADIQIAALPPNINANLRFDNTNPAIRDTTARAGERVIQNVQADAQQVIADAVTRSFKFPMTPRAVASQIKGSIGLLPAHVAAVERYRQNLVASGMPAQRVDELVGGYESRLLDYRAMMIARTETRYAINAGQLAVWHEAVNQGFVDRDTAQKEWVVDGDPCSVCKPMDGVRVGLYDAWTITYDDGSTDQVYNPTDSHPHCFPPGQPVLTKRGYVAIEFVKIGDEVLTHQGRWRRVQNAFSKPYAGMLQTIRTTGGIIRSTPDHKFLVSGQWLTAAKINKGQDAFKVRSPAEVLLKQVGHKPAMLCQIVELPSVLIRFFLAAVPRSALYLKGDPLAREAKIDVELVDLKQRYRIISAIVEGVQKTQFKWRELAAKFSGNGFADLFSFRGYATTTSSVGFGGMAATHVKRGGLVAQELGFSNTPNAPARSAQNPRDDASVHPIVSSQGLDASSEVISLKDRLLWKLYRFCHVGTRRTFVCDKILDISTETYSGPVYNLTVEEDHSYTVSDVVVHNCMCGMELHYGHKGEDEGEEE